MAAARMPIASGARIAVIGAGPGGLVVAKHALQAGYDTTVFEASNDLGGQWCTTAPHSGVWPGMRTNTSQSMTAFSDFDVPAAHELHPLAEQVQSYLRGYAAAFGVTPRIRFDTPVRSVGPGWMVNGEPFDAVVVASGRFRAPQVPPALDGFQGEVLHAYDYPGAAHFAGRRTLLRCPPRSGVGCCGPGSSGSPGIRLTTAHPLRIATSSAPASRSARATSSRSARASSPVARRSNRWPGRPSPSPTGRGSRSTPSCAQLATGLTSPTAPEVRALLGHDLRLHLRTLHPDVPGLAFVGQFALQGPYFPLLELQARWIIGTWSGDVPPAPEDAMRASIAVGPPALDSHNVLAVALAEAAGVAPDLRSRPELAEALLFGPMLPSRYRLDGPGARPDAAARFAVDLQRAPRPAVEADDIAALTALGLADLLAS